MSIRTTPKIVKFSKPFSIEGVGRILPAGNYEVVIDEELIEGLSFPVYRRVATMMLAPKQSSQAPSIEMLTIDPRDLEAAVERDTLAVKGVFSAGKTAMMQCTLLPLKIKGKTNMAMDIIQANIDRFNNRNRPEEAGNENMRACRSP